MNCEIAEKVRSEQAAGDAASVPEGAAAASSAAVAALGPRIRSLRSRSRCSLSELAARSGVSRAMLSKVERGEKSQTLAIIVRIAAGLNIPLSELMAMKAAASPSSPAAASRYIPFSDPESGFERHVLRPAASQNGVEFLLHKIPPRQSSGTLTAYKTSTEKYIVVTRGRLTVCIGDARHVVAEGESFHFSVTVPYRFVNEGEAMCEYYLVVVKRLDSAWASTARVPARGDHAMTCNLGDVDRALRMVIGVAALALVAVGPRTFWGLVGFYPVLTARFGWCPLYAAAGFATRPKAL